MTALLTEDNIADILFSARAGEQDDLVALTKDLTTPEVLEIKDSLNNTPLHMASANGHLGKLS